MASDSDSDKALDEWERQPERLHEDGSTEGAFVVDVEGFEGPLDLMLQLARNHKLDLTKISVLYLAEQYLLFIEQARRLRLDIAADYLVMAAWLTFLKSKLLLPDEEALEEGLSGDEMAERLAFRLQRLEAMRGAAEILMQGPQLGEAFFARGMPEGITLVRDSQYEADIYDLLAAYASGRLRKAASVIKPGVERRKVWSLKQAWARLERILGYDCSWAPLDVLLREFIDDPEQGRTVLAASFGASLEMAREGRVELRQGGTFEPLYLRRKDENK